MSFFTTLFAQSSQNFSLSGTIDSGNINQIEINLFNSENKLIKTEVADQNGKFIFNDLISGNYNLKINKSGTEVYQSQVSVNENITLPSISLNEKSIEAVTITKTKPYIERQDGKMILNVENSIASTGNSAFEVLEKAPGVNIDSNDNISMRGKANLLVQIDGKNTPMTGTDLANYLRGMPSSTVEKIEFITNPSSKYDASGTSIINIRLKKGPEKRNQRQSFHFPRNRKICEEQQQFQHQSPKQKSQSFCQLQLCLQRILQQIDVGQKLL
ncbi:Cna protein B-type domain protein [compost metagenome]